MEIITLIIIIFAGFIMEIIDAGLGMGYGTVLSPLLLGFGYSPLVVVPSILISQAIGGLTAALFHQKHEHANFKLKTTNIKKIKESLKKLGYVTCFKKGFSKDLKIVITITILGVLGTIIGVFVAVHIPKWLLKTYIGILVLIVGFLLLLKKSFNFSWKKMIGVGVLASFNKGMSGGGFGPIVTGGQVIAGNKHKNSIACTSLAEVPICIVGFTTYVLLNRLITYDLAIGLSIGALIGAPVGTLITKKLNSKKLKYILGILIIILGAWTIIKLLI